MANSSINPLKISKNFLYLLSGEALGKVFGFAAFAFIARTLGPKGYATIEFALSLMNILSFFVFAGILTIGMREIAANKEDAGKIAGSVLTMRLLLAFLAYGALFIILTLFKNPSKEQFNVTLIYGISFFAMALTFDWVLNALERMGSIGFQKLLQPFVYFCGVILFVKSSKDIYAIAWAYQVSLWIVMLLLMIVILRSKIEFWREISLRGTLKKLSDSFPIGISEILIRYTQNIGVVVLGFYGIQEWTGWYGAAHRLYLTAAIINIFYYIVLFPVYSRMVKESPDKIPHFMRDSIRLPLLVAIPIGIICFDQARFLITTLLGQEFAPSVGSFRFLIFALLFSIPTGIFRIIFITTKKVNLELSLQCLGAGVVTFVLLFFLPIMGYQAAGLALFCSELITLCLYSWLISFHICKIDVLKTVLYPSLAGIGMILTIYYLSVFPVILKLGLGALVYLFIVWIMGLMPIREIKVLFGKLL